MKASRMGHLRTMRMLLVSGADPNAKKVRSFRSPSNVNHLKMNGWTPLMYASMHNHIEAVKLLIKEAQVSKMAKNKDGALFRKQLTS
jgi:ankyrin repeat protein